MRLTTGDLCRVRDATGINLAFVTRGTDWIDEVLADPVRLASVLRALGRDEPDRRLDGAILGVMFGEVVRAVTDWFPEPKAKRRDAGADESKSPGDFDGLELAEQLAGVCGVDPNPLTLRQLATMADGRQQSDWQKVAAVVCTVVNRGISRKPVNPKQVIPEAFQPKAEPAPDVSDEELAAGWAKFDRVFNVNNWQEQQTP
jgi:hypothetical protein